MESYFVKTSTKAKSPRRIAGIDRIAPELDGQIEKVAEKVGVKMYA